MSPKLTAAPEPPLVSDGPQPVPSKPAPQKKAPVLWVVLILMLAAAGAWLARPKPQARPAIVVVPTARALKGVLQSKVRLSGTVEAQRYSNLVGPQTQAPDSGRGMTLLYLIDNGSHVKEGDVVAQIDPQAVKDHLDDVEANVNQTEMELRRLKAQQAAETEAAAQRVRAAKGVLDRARQDLLALDVRSRIDQEKLRLAVSEAQATYEELESEVPLVEERHEAQLNLSQFNQDYQIRHRNRHRADLARFDVKSPMDGQVVIRPIYRNGEQGQVKVGDQLSPGQLFARVVDTSSLAVETTINQAESELLHIGQKAKVRLDAYPGVIMDGHVEAVGTLAAGGRRTNYYIRRIPVRIAIDGADPLLIPDLSASADVVISETDNGVIVPREAVVETSGKTVVYVKQDGVFTPREVEIGGYSNTGVSVTSGLHAGDEVSLQPGS